MVNGHIVKDPWQSHMPSMRRKVKMRASKGPARMALVPTAPRASPASAHLVVWLWEPLYPLFMLRLA